MITPTADYVADVIGVPVEEWPGRCHEIATLAVETGVLEGRTEYGIWLGPIAPDSLFGRRPVARHGWIRLEDGRVADPTRWVFEGAEPYIYIGDDDFYDLGGARFRAEVTGRGWASETQVFEFLDDPAGADLETLRLLAHTPPDVYPFYMAEVYDEIARRGEGALIPIDFRRAVEHKR